MALSWNFHQVCFSEPVDIRDLATLGSDSAATYTPLYRSSSQYPPKASLEIWLFFSSSWSLPFANRFVGFHIKTHQTINNKFSDEVLSAACDGFLYCCFIVGYTSKFRTLKIHKGCDTGFFSHPLMIEKCKSWPLPSTQWGLVQRDYWLWFTNITISTLPSSLQCECICMLACTSGHFDWLPVFASDYICMAVPF